MYIPPRGNPNARVWIIFQSPYKTDEANKTLLSGGMGHVFTKQLTEAGLSLSDCYLCTRRPDTEDVHSFVNLDGEIGQYKPPFILVVGDVAGWFLPELREKQSIETSKGQLEKYAGSLLSSDKFQHPHYIMPLQSPDRCVGDWVERNVTVYFDLQKFRDEWQFWKKNARLRPLPERVLKFHDMDMDELLSHLDRFSGAQVLSADIENPTYNSKLYSPHPGYPFLVGLGDSKDFGISFKLFRDKPSENRILWRKLDELIYNTPVLLGQNIFNYDALHFNTIGFRVPLERTQDTLLRHHILWPELPHKLQFMTRQYTREPYYKDEGHGWTMKFLDKYRRYNALDVCVTREVYDEQEEEFKQKPHLR